MEQGKETRAGLRVEAKPSQGIKREVKQWVRTIGITDSPESQSVKRVDADLANLINQGWILHTVQPIGSGVGGSVIVYYLLIK